MGVGLVADVEDEGVLRRMENAVQRHHQLHRAQGGAEVSPDAATHGNNFLAQRLAERRELGHVQRAQRLGRVHALKQRQAVRSTL